MIDFFKIINKRRSVRNFVKAEIPRSDLRKIVNAGRFAPCGGNRQEWHFIVVTDKKIILKILAYLKFSKVLSSYLGIKKSFPLFKKREILTESRKLGRLYSITESTDFLNTSAVIAIAFNSKWHFYKEDGSAAVENMLLAATALGYGSCWVQGQIRPHLNELEKLLNIPLLIRLFTMIVIGKPKKWPKAPAKKKIEEILHWNKF